MYEPLISVIIPVYNPGEYFERCIESIINQKYRKLQILLVDDGSSDGSEIKCDQYAASDSRVIVIHQHNAGVSSARNAGIEKAIGEYLYFPDSDDYLEVSTLYDIVCKLNIKRYDVINFDYYISFNDHETPAVMKERDYGEKNRVQSQILVMNWQPFTWNKLFSKRIVDQGIRFSESICRGEDTLFIQKVLLLSQNTLFCKGNYYHYVQTEQSACRGRFRSTQLTAIRLIDEYEKLFGPDRFMLTLSLERLLKIFIGIYIDIKNSSYTNQQDIDELLRAYTRAYRAISTKQLGLDSFLKLSLFRISPNLYYFIWRFRNNEKSFQ